MNEVELKKLWDALQDRFDVGTFDEFKTKMSTVDLRKKFFNKMSEKGFDLGKYEDYENRLKGNTTQQTVPSQIQGFDDKPCAKNVKNPVQNQDGSITYDSDSAKGKVTLKSDGTFTSASAGFESGTWSCTQTGKVYLDNTQAAKSSSSAKQAGSSTQSSASSMVDTNITSQDIVNGALVKRGMKGKIVGDIQNYLINHGYKAISADGNVDNIFGSRTKKMVVDFQTSKGLKPDGVVGPLTWAELIKAPSSSNVSAGSVVTKTKDMMDAMSKGKWTTDSKTENKTIEFVDNNTGP